MAGPVPLPTVGLPPAGAPASLLPYPLRPVAGGRLTGQPAAEVAGSAGTAGIRSEGGDADWTGPADGLVSDRPAVARRSLGVPVALAGYRRPSRMA